MGGEELLVEWKSGEIGRKGKLERGTGKHGDWLLQGAS